MKASLNCLSYDNHFLRRKSKRMNFFAMDFISLEKIHIFYRKNYKLRHFLSKNHLRREIR